MNIITKTTQLVHYLALSYLNKDAITIDCTCGNGHDTLFLAENSKFVYGFDVQQEAIDNTEKLLKENNLHNYKLIKDGHENVDKYINCKCDVVIFNLGYLPKSDKKITTMAKTTVVAIDKCLNLLKDGGVIFITAYYGHQNGKIEREEILSYLHNIDGQKYMIRKIISINNDKMPPEIYIITSKN